MADKQEIQLTNQQEDALSLLNSLAPAGALERESLANSFNLAIRGPDSGLPELLHYATLEAERLAMHSNSGSVNLILEPNKTFMFINYPGQYGALKIFVFDPSLNEWYELYGPNDTSGEYTHSVYPSGIAYGMNIRNVASIKALGFDQAFWASTNIQAIQSNVGFSPFMAPDEIRSGIGKRSNMEIDPMKGVTLLGAPDIEPRSLPADGGAWLQGNVSGSPPDARNVVRTYVAPNSSGAEGWDSDLDPSGSEKQVTAAWQTYWGVGLNIPGLPYTREESEAILPLTFRGAGKLVMSASCNFRLQGTANTAASIMMRLVYYKTVNVNGTVIRYKNQISSCQAKLFYQSSGVETSHACLSTMGEVPQCTFIDGLALECKNAFGQGPATVYMSNHDSTQNVMIQAEEDVTERSYALVTNFNSTGATYQVHTSQSTLCTFKRGEAGSLNIPVGVSTFGASKVREAISRLAFYTGPGGFAPLQPSDMQAFMGLGSIWSGIKKAVSTIGDGIEDGLSMAGKGLARGIGRSIYGLSGRSTADMALVGRTEYADTPTGYMSLKSPPGGEEEEKEPRGAVAYMGLTGEGGATGGAGSGADPPTQEPDKTGEAFLRFARSNPTSAAAALASGIANVEIQTPKLAIENFPDAWFETVQLSADQVITTVKVLNSKFKALAAAGPINWDDGTNGFRAAVAKFLGEDDVEYPTDVTDKVYEVIEENRSAFMAVCADIRTARELGDVEPMHDLLTHIRETWVPSDFIDQVGGTAALSVIQEKLEYQMHKQVDMDITNKMFDSVRVEEELVTEDGWEWTNPHHRVSYMGLQEDIEKNRIKIRIDVERLDALPDNALNATNLTFTGEGKPVMKLPAGIIPSQRTFLEAGQPATVSWVAAPAASPDPSMRYVLSLMRANRPVYQPADTSGGVLRFRVEAEIQTDRGPRRCVIYIAGLNTKQIDVARAAVLGHAASMAFREADLQEANYTVVINVPGTNASRTASSRMDGTPPSHMGGSKSMTWFPLMAENLTISGFSAALGFQALADSLPCGVAFSGAFSPVNYTPSNVSYVDIKIDMFKAIEKPLVFSDTSNEYVFGAANPLEMFAKAVIASSQRKPEVRKSPVAPQPKLTGDQRIASKVASHAKEEEVRQALISRAEELVEEARSAIEGKTGMPDSWKPSRLNKLDALETQIRNALNGLPKHYGKAAYAGKLENVETLINRTLAGVIDAVESAGKVGEPGTSKRKKKKGVNAVDQLASGGFLASFGDIDL